MPRLVAALALFAALAVTLHAQIPGIFSTVSVDGNLTWNAIEIDAPNTGEADNRAWLRGDGAWTGVGLADVDSDFATQEVVSTGTTWRTVTDASVTVESGDDVIVSVNGDYERTDRGGTWYYLERNTRIVRAVDFRQGAISTPTTVGTLPSTYAYYEPFPSTWTGLTVVGNTLYVTGHDSANNEVDLWSASLSDIGAATNGGAIANLGGTGVLNQYRPLGMYGLDGSLYILARRPSGSGGLKYRVVTVDPANPGAATTQNIFSQGGCDAPSEAENANGGTGGMHRNGDEVYVMCDLGGSNGNRLIHYSTTFQVVSSNDWMDNGTYTAITDDAEGNLLAIRGQRSVREFPGGDPDAETTRGDLGTGDVAAGFGFVGGAGCEWRLRRGTTDVATFDWIVEKIRLRTPFVDAPPTGTHQYMVQIRAGAPDAECRVRFGGETLIMPSMLVQAFYGS